MATPNQPRRRPRLTLLDKANKPLGPRQLPPKPDEKLEEANAAANGGKHTIEHLANELGVEPWKYWAAKAAKAWPDHAEVEHDEFIEAIEAAGNVRIG
ncbi:MAG TPA: hypothetical protein VMB50_20820 [Myxococcales bacterium]|nr:hypothetical protein [Myxococcales bacterium]